MCSKILTENGERVIVAIAFIFIVVVIAEALAGYFG